MPRVVLALLPVVLLIYGLIDCARDPDVRRTPFPKWAWLLAIILLPVVGAVAWLIVSRVVFPPFDEAPEPAPGPSTRVPGPTPRPQRPPRSSGPIGPDDDPEFLNKL